MSPCRNWDPLSLNRVTIRVCSPPPEPNGGRAHSPAGEGVRESKFQRLEKKLSSLSTLWNR